MPVAVSSLRVCRPVATKSMPAAPAAALRYFSSASSSRRPAGLVDARAGLARPGGRLAAEPLRLAADLVGDRLLPARLGFEELLAPLGEVVVGAGGAEVAAGVDAADLDHLVGDGPQERPVVRGDQVAERGGPQQPLQPDDARQVEVVGRLVEQQQVGLADQLAGQGQPLAPAAGEDVGRLVGVGEADLRQRDGRPRFALVVLDRLVGEGGEQHLADGLAGGEDVVLGEIAERGRARRSERVPASGSSRPASSFSSVDLPEPFGPIRPTRSPARRSSDRSVNSGRGPSLGQLLHAQQDGHASASSIIIHVVRDTPILSRLQLGNYRTAIS